MASEEIESQKILPYTPRLHGLNGYEPKLKSRIGFRRLYSDSKRLP
jgi:hypothetical protein